MRTTIDLHEDVLVAVKERARQEKRSAGDVLSELARQALTAPPASSEVAEGSALYGFEPFPRRGGLVTNERINQIRDEEPE